jgi:serine/threonine protein kinase
MVSQMSSASSKKVAKQFKLLSKIGSGSFGAVYEARHEPTGCIVAIKVNIEATQTHKHTNTQTKKFHFEKDKKKFAFFLSFFFFFFFSPPSMGHRQCVQGDDDDVQREMQMQQQQQCADIVAFYGHFEKDSQLFLVMELCSVGAVTDLMRVCQCTLSEHQIAVVVRGALGALHYMHEKKGVHRDIKTDNILLSARGEPKLGDFGVSRQLGAGESRMRTIAGTPYFIAPEILSSEQPGYNTKADIWSVGISMIEMAEGHPPYFDEHPMRVLFFIPTKPAPTLAEPGLWSPDMHDFLSLCLLKDPAKRPSAVELLRHPWLAAAPDCTVAFGELIAQYDAIVAQYGSRSKALKALKKADGKADKESSKADKKKPSNKRDDKRQRRRERREKARQKHSDDDEEDDEPAAPHGGSLPPPPPHAFAGVPPPLPPDAPSAPARTHSAPATSATGAAAPLVRRWRATTSIAKRATRRATRATTRRAMPTKTSSL